MNLLDALPSAAGGEVFTRLIARPGVRVERIVSLGQATPEDAPFVQSHEEWVVLLAGAARMRLGDAPEVTLAPGDTLTIPADVPHWVTWTDPEAPTVWLALHFV